MTKKRKIAVAILLILSIATLAFIWINSMLSQDMSTAESTAVYGGLYPIVNWFFKIFIKDGITHATFRKLAHWGEYAVLGLELTLLIITLKKVKYKFWLMVIAFGLFTASIDECIQILSSRGPTFIDVLIDFWGFCTSYLIVLVIFLIAKKKRETPKRA